MILYKLRDPESAPELAQHFEQLFQHEARSWQEREQSNLQLLLTLRLSTAITVSLIILLAGFGFFTLATMSVDLEGTVAGGDGRENATIVAGAMMAGLAAGSTAAEI